MPRFANAPSIFREREPPRDRLRKLVREMTRARHDQLLLDQVAVSVLGAVIASTVWVALARFTPSGIHPGAGVAALLLLALLAAVAVARRRRPTRNRVAIDADIRLGLEQTLSTAWEFEARGADPALIERLARQAVRAHRLPRVGERVFPLRLTRPAKLVPLAALVLLLVTVAEPQRESVPDTPVLDPVLAQQGERLREHGLAMQSRAQHAGLTRSAEASQELQRLGSHMRDGLLAREPALERLRALAMNLREQSRLAAGDAGEAPLQPGALRGLSSSSPGVGEALQVLQQKLMAGTLNELDLQELADLAANLAGATMSTEELQSLIERIDEGDREALRRLLERLSRGYTAMREVDELELADEEVRRARESLGDDDLGRRRLSAVAGGPRDAEDTAGVLGARGAARDPGDNSERGSAYLLGRGSGGAGDDDTSSKGRSRESPDTASVAMRPRSRLREGELRHSEARVLPRSGVAGVASIALDREFATQIEEVLSKEEVPLHHKELIRRYFNSLSTAPESGPGGDR